jgi:hypothetical protein
MRCAEVHEARRGILLVQLYGPLQPPDAEPLSVATLAGHVAAALPELHIVTCAANPLLEPNAASRIANLAIHGEFEIVGLSVPQGTLSLALETMESLKACPSERRPQVVLGHALPTYFPEPFLTRDSSALILRGWAEQSLVSIVAGLARPGFDLGAVPGLTRMVDGRVATSPIVNLPSLKLLTSPPRRLQGQFFRRIESSRGCGYGMCTFCTRPPGDRGAWARFPLERVFQDVHDLRSKGARHFTFTDEDFIGADPDGAKMISRVVKEAGDMTYTASVRATSLLHAVRPTRTSPDATELLTTLRHHGLAKVFLGVESLSRSQLRRYGKGGSPHSAIIAVNLLLHAGIDVEVGFIPFDPLVTEKELLESYSLLWSSGLWRVVGSPFSRVRIQPDSRLVADHRYRAFLTDFDTDCMSWNWSFRNPRVHEIYELCNSWWRDFDPVYSALRNIDRSRQVENIQRAIQGVREASVRASLVALECTADPSSPERYLKLERLAASRNGIVESMVDTLTKSRLAFSDPAVSYFLAAAANLRPWRTADAL